MSNASKDIRIVLATDCGSTTTKAILFEKTEAGWRQTYRGEAPTTVEKPVADVTIGALNAFLEIQELSGRKIVRDDFESNSETSPLIIRKSVDEKDGVDLYVSTSSAGGGLQMVVLGVVKDITTESAERAALGAGAIVMDAISLDDGREPHERVKKIRHLRPDIVLIAGGTDGGTREHPLELAEIVLQADPRPRFGETLTLPVIYAGNSEAKEDVKELLEKKFELSFVDNLRPALNVENLTPARDAIHELFLHHVMSHAPGYKKLLGYSPVPILPTPAAFGDMVQSAARFSKKSILAVDIGGATTDVFSVLYNDQSEAIFNRTVSANLGMSYSIANVLLEAGEENILRWLPYEMEKEELRDRLRNKMIRPTSIPFTKEDLQLEQAICREALRLSFEHHKRLAVGLKGVMRTRSIADMFSQTAASGIDMMKLDLIIGSGGVLSHAPDRKDAAMMLIDAYEPQGVTELAVDSIFMMPHLGVLSSVNPEAANEILYRDCLVSLGTAIVPCGEHNKKKALLRANFSDGTSLELKSGELVTKEVKGECEVEIEVLQGGLNVGAGRGKTLKAKVQGGEAGVVLDGRLRR